MDRQGHIGGFHLPELLLHVFPRILPVQVHVRPGNHPQQGIRSVVIPAAVEQGLDVEFVHGPDHQDPHHIGAGPVRDFLHHLLFDGISVSPELGQYFVGPFRRLGIGQEGELGPGIGLAHLALPHFLHGSRGLSRMVIDHKGDVFPGQRFPSRRPRCFRRHQQEQSSQEETQGQQQVSYPFHFNTPPGLFPGSVPAPDGGPGSVPHHHRYPWAAGPPV